MCDSDQSGRPRPASSQILTQLSWPWLHWPPRSLSCTRYPNLVQIITGKPNTECTFCNVFNGLSRLLFLSFLFFRFSLFLCFSNFVMFPSNSSECHVRFDDHNLSPMASSISFPEYPSQKPLKSALRRSSVQLSTSPRLNSFPMNDSRVSLSSSIDSSKAPKSNSSRKAVKVRITQLRTLLY